VTVLLARGRYWRVTLVRKRTSVVLHLDDPPADLADLDDFEAEVPLARWNAVVRNVDSDRKLLGGVLLDAATAKDRVARVVGSDPILSELQRIVRDATVALVEAGATVIAPAEEEES
jgi:hypothetical protein